MGCDRSGTAVLELNSHFQYPRTDRMGCDSPSSMLAPRRGNSFSILERIEWAATRPPPLQR